MKIHYLQHVAFEGLGSIEDWIRNSEHDISCTRFYQGDVLPDVRDIDWLIVMGGPMGVNDIEQYPWLTAEKEFIRNVIELDRLVLGICLGAQLIAAALDAAVVRNPVKEIGWYPVRRADTLSGHQLARIIPENIEVFHWHGDTFAIPDKAVRIADSQGCTNQGFIYRDRTIALQFHLESTMDGIKRLINNCGDEISAAPFIQAPERMLADKTRVRKINDLMFKILDYQSSLYKTG